jgi:putative endonuclease
MADGQGISHPGAALEVLARRNRPDRSARKAAGVRRGERARLDDAAESVTERQKQRIAAAAEIWLAANPDDAIRDIRFDAILVAPGKLPRHIPAAFETN